MKLSIVMPVYNVEKYIRECVDSILNQTMKEFELIIVDDGSTDSSGAILDEYQAKDNRITVIHKANGGVSAARNDALDICTGDYIYIMDSDDYLEQDAFQVMYEEAIRTDADVVIVDHSKFVKQEEQLICHYFPECFVTDDRNIILQIQKMILHKGYSPYLTSEDRGLGIGAPWTKLIRRELIEKNGLRFDPYVRGVFDDCLFSIHVFEYVKKVAYKKDITYHFRVLQSSLTHKYRQNQLEVYGRIFERIQDFCKKYNKDMDFQRAYFARVVLYLSISFDTYFFNKEYDKGRKKNFQEFMKTIKSDVYHKAILEVDASRLMKREKRIVIFCRMHVGWLLWFLYAVKHAIR